MITLLLVDDHQIVRQGLRVLLEREDDVQIVGEAGDGLEAVRQIENLQPDVVILDLTIPKLSGLEVLRQIGKAAPDTRVIVFSVHASEPYVVEALKHGVSGYVLKDAPTEELVRAVREIVAGRHYLSPPLSERIIQGYLESIQTDELDAYETLTRREREVLHLVAEGHTNPKIAGLLSISPRTVEDHRSRLMRKLRLDSQIDLVRYALQRGIIPPS